MKRAIIAVVVVAAAGLAAAAVLRAGGHADPVATVTVGKSKFVRRVHADGSLRAVKATPITPPALDGELSGLTIAWLAPDGSIVHKGDPLIKFDATAAQKQLRAGQDDRATAAAKISQEQLKASAAVHDRARDAQIAADDLASARQFQSKDTEIFSRNDIIASALDEQLATAKQRHADSARAIEGQRVQANVAVIQVERQKADTAISHAQSALASMQVTAPHDGIFVLSRNKWSGELPKLGDNVWGGMTLGELPLLDEMEAEVYVLEVDGNGLAVDKPAEIVVEAQPDQVYAGKIKIVQKLAKSRERGSPVQYFEAIVALAKTDPKIMKPGARVAATLVLDQEDALVVPREAIADRDGKEIAFRQTATGFEEVAVTLGAATAGRVVVASGLREGDVIALRDPNTSRDGSGSGSSAGAAAGGAPSAPGGAKGGP